MLTKHIKHIIKSEILCDSYFTNIDRTDIEHFKQGLIKIEDISVESDIVEIEKIFMKTLSDIKEKNAEMTCAKILFVLKFSEQTILTMDDLSFIDEAMDDKDGGLECIWGMSVDNEIPQGQIKLIVLFGFKKLNDFN